MPADPVPGSATRPAPPLGRALAVYTALRVGLMAVLSVLARLLGLPWLLAVTVGVLVAAILSLFVLRGPMGRLSSAIAGSRGRSAPGSTPRTRVGPSVPGATPGIYADDSDDSDDSEVDDSGDPDDPYAADPYAADPYADSDRDERRPAEPAPAQDLRSNATPTSRP